MKGFATPVSISSGMSVDEAVHSLRSSFDRPLSEKDPWGVVDAWTVFGEMCGEEIRAETAGTFGGWSARNGFGVWQPVFRGRVTAAAHGSVLNGRICLRRSFLLVLAFLLVWSVSLVAGLTPLIAGDLAAGNVGGFAGRVALLALMVGVPATWIAFVWRKGVQEAGALHRRLELAVSTRTGATDGGGRTQDSPTLRP
jgi:hypothetical protein